MLGEGAFAKVMRVKDQNKSHFALKIVVAPPERLHEAEREVVILKKISGIPHVTQIHRDYSDKCSYSKQKKWNHSITPDVVFYMQSLFI